MKKLLSIMLLLATMLTFASCEDKNEPETNDEEIAATPYLGVYFAERSETYKYDGAYYRRRYESTMRVNKNGTIDWKDTDYKITDPYGHETAHPELRQKFSYKYSIADGLMIIKDSDGNPIWVANCTSPNLTMDMTNVKEKPTFTLMFQKDDMNFDAK